MTLRFGAAARLEDFADHAIAFQRLPAAPICAKRVWVMRETPAGYRPEIAPNDAGKVKTETQFANWDARRSSQHQSGHHLQLSAAPIGGSYGGLYKPDRDRPQQIRRSDHHRRGLSACENVAYWPELVDIFNWAAGNVTQHVGPLLGAQALLYHFYSLPKVEYPGKLSGVYEHRRVADAIRLFRLR